MLPAEQEESLVDEAPPRAEKRPERPAAQQDAAVETEPVLFGYGLAAAKLRAFNAASSSASSSRSCTVGPSLGCRLTGSGESELPIPPRKKQKAMRDLQVYLTSQARKMRWLLTWNHPSADADSSFGDGTKGQEQAQLNLFYKLGGRWRLVYDETYTSAKKRKKNCTQPLEDVQQPVTEMDSADSESSDDAFT